MYNFITGSTIAKFNARSTQLYDFVQPIASRPTTTTPNARYESAR
jgi:hypothetical protein